MLRHLLISAARTSSRSLFAKPKAPVSVSSLRTLSSHKLSSQISPLSQKQSSLSQEPEDVSAQFTTRPFSQKQSGSGPKEPSEPQLASLGFLLGMAGAGYLFHEMESRLEQQRRQANMKLCHVIYQPTLEKAIQDEAKLKKANEYKVEKKAKEYDADDFRVPTQWRREHAPRFTEPFEGVKVSYVLTRPVCLNWFDKEGTNVMYQVVMIVHTPCFKSRHWLEQMCERFKLRGIDVECSEDGIRRGLSEYALKYTQETVRTHLEKKCGKCDLSTGPYHGHVEPLTLVSRCVLQTNDENNEEFMKNIKICRKDFHPKLPTSGSQDAVKKATPFDNGAVTFEITRPFFPKWLEDEGTFTCLAVEVNVNLPNFTATADIKEICEGLKRHGINVDSSESGLRRGLAEYALNHMNEGITKHLEKKCDCGYFSTPFAVPPK